MRCLELRWRPHLALIIFNIQDMCGGLLVPQMRVITSCHEDIGAYDRGAHPCWANPLPNAVP